jgi:uncharacterized Zn finger protein
VAVKKANAEKLIANLKKTRPDIQPICPTGRNLAQSFWGKAWCKHLETYADHENRIGRGHSYVRNSAVCHLAATAGHITALVAGSQGKPYEVNVTVRPLSANQWKTIKAASQGRIASMLDLLAGKFPADIMKQAADPENGIFPKLGELKFSCSCPDWAQMCKHVAATLYAFGHRLDHAPELLFLLRGVDPAELIDLENMAEAATGGSASALKDESLAAIFGIELDLGGMEKPVPKAADGKKAATRKKEAIPAAPAQTRPKRARAKSQLFKDPDNPQGSEIKALRQKLKMSQAEFAAALGSALPTVLNWENLKEPRLHQKSKDKLAALAKRGK